MAETAPAGLESTTKTVSVSPAYSGGDVLVSVRLPANAAVWGLDLVTEQLDEDGTPTLLLDVGDTLDDDRFLAADDVAQAGGTVEVRLEQDDFHRYSNATDVEVTVNTVGATDVAGEITLTVYWYYARPLTTVTDNVLRELGVLAAGETATAEDARTAREALEEVHQVFRQTKSAQLTLAQKGDLEWPLALVPQFAARAYATAAALRLADDFGVSDAAINRLSARQARHMIEFRESVAEKTTGEPVEAEFY